MFQIFQRGHTKAQQNEFTVDVDCYFLVRRDLRGAFVGLTSSITAEMAEAVQIEVFAKSRSTGVDVLPRSTCNTSFVPT